MKLAPPIILTVAYAMLLAALHMWAITPAENEWGAIHGTYIPPENPRSE